MVSDRGAPRPFAVSIVYPLFSQIARPLICDISTISLAFFCILRRNGGFQSGKCWILGFFQADPVDKLCYTVNWGVTHQPRPPSECVKKKGNPFLRPCAARAPRRGHVPSGKRKKRSAKKRVRHYGHKKSRGEALW